MINEIVGLIVCNDVLLETREPLQIRRGLNVIYGLNGAGKSRLLGAIQSVLLGIDGDTTVALLIRIRTDPTASTPTPRVAYAEEEHARVRASVYGRTPAEAIAAALAQPGDFAFEDREFPTPADEKVPTAVVELIERWTQSRVGPETKLAREILDDGLFLFAPTGSRSVPSWDAWPVADTRQPYAAAALVKLDELAERQWNMPGDDPSYFDAIGELEDAVIESPLFATLFNEIWSVGSNRRLLTPAPFMPYAIDEHSAPNVEPVRVTGKIDFGLELIDTTQEPEEATQGHIGTLHSFLLTAIGDRKQEISLATFRDAGVRLLSPAIRTRLVEDREPELDWGAALALMGADNQEVGADAEGIDVSQAERVIAEVAADLENRVNSILRSVLLDAPSAKLHIESAVLRFIQKPLVWKFGPRRLRLRELSRAEQLWASRAIHEAIHYQARDLALGEGQRRTVLSLVDEPEAALHRTAEAHMAATLRRRGADDIVVAATHSPELLDAPEGRVVEVKRGGGSHGRSLVHELDQGDKAVLSQLGLAPSDLLRWPRVILLVEGEHDEVLLEAFLGDRLRAARVKVLPLHGGSKLPGTVDSQVLFDHTDAHVVALLDNLHAARLRDVWERAVSLAVRGEAGLAKQEVISGLPDDRKRKGDEAGYMRSWLTKAIDAGLAARATPYGLEEVDIIRYLPVGKVVPGAENWEQLETQHRNEMTAARPDKRPPADFKQWLAARWKVTISPVVLRDAATDIPVPRDFQRLMKLLEALSSEVR